MPIFRMVRETHALAEGDTIQDGRSRRIMRIVALAWFLILAGVAIATAGGAVAWLGLAMWLGGVTLQAVVILVSLGASSHRRYRYPSSA